MCTNLQTHNTCTLVHLCKCFIYFFPKSDTKLHSGIKALHTRADTWSFSCCQRGLAIELRCLEGLEEFTPPTFCSSHSYTQAAGSPEKWKLIILCYHKHISFSYYYMQRHKCVKEHNELCRLEPISVPWDVWKHGACNGAKFFERLAIKGKLKKISFRYDR